MACCSSRRNVQAPALRPLAASPPPTQAPAAEPTPLRYVGGQELALKGPASGRIYRVGMGARTVSAAAGDVRALLASGLFVRA